MTDIKPGVRWEAKAVQHICSVSPPGPTPPTFCGNIMHAALAVRRSYAAAIAEVLDPSGRLFGHRIIAQGAAGDGVQQDLTKRLMQVQQLLVDSPLDCADVRLMGVLCMSGATHCHVS